VVESEGPMMFMPNLTTGHDGQPIPLPPELMTITGDASKCSIPNLLSS